jgi:uncharacterized protein
LKEVFEMDRVKVLRAKGISPGRSTGPALVWRERLALRGFADLEEGTFTGGMGELEGVSFAGTVLVFPSSKGSTLWSITLDLACRFGNAPAAMINSKLDPFVALGCVLEGIPLVQVEDTSIFDEVKNGDVLTVDADRGEVSITQTG